MYREQLDRPGVSALVLQPGMEKGGGVAWSSSENNNLVRERGASIAPNNINSTVLAIYVAAVRP